MISPHYSKHWLDLYDGINAYIGNYNFESLFSEPIEGFWVIFIEENIWKNTNLKNEFINNSITFMNKYNIPFIRIALPYHDRLIVFTTSSKREIKDIQIQLQKHFNFKRENMFWIANFESENSWDKNGWLNIMNKSFNELENIVSKSDKKSKNFKYAISLRSKAYKKILEEIIMLRKSMVVTPSFGSIDYNIKEKSVFIIMPFGENWSDDVCKCIKEVCYKLNIIAVRADDFMSPGVVLDDIWKGINEAELIVADITVHNANVFYELGMAHTLGKDVVLIHQKDGEKVPFDINSRRYVSYGLLPSEFEKFKNDLNLVINNFFHE